MIKYLTGCCGLLCYPCQTHKTANSLNKSGALYCLLACFFPCLPALLLRQETRHRWETWHHMEDK